MRRKKIFLSVFLLAGAAVIGLYLASGQLESEETRLTSSVAHVLFRNNFHPVVDGRIYRAAEMPEEDLRRRIREYGIRTVLDVRLGGGETFYGGRSEQSVVEEEGANYVHFQLRGSRVPSKESVEELLDAFDSLELPVMVHCTSGTHRSGVVSALWLMEKEQVSPKIAAKQLSPQYGFFRKERELKSLIQGHPTIDYLVWMYLEHVEKYGVSDEGQQRVSFRQWLDGRETL